MFLKASIVVMSHLSDTKMEIGFNQRNANLRIEFVKYIILKCEGNLNQDIDADKMWKEFLKTQVELNEPAPLEILSLEMLNKFITSQMLTQVSFIVRAGNRLEALKLVRKLCNDHNCQVDLKTAKTYVDNLAATM